MVDDRQDLAAGVPLEAVLALARAVLHEAGVAEAAREARLIVQHAAGLEPARVIAGPSILLGALDVRRIEEMVRRRALREPLSRIIGRRGFYGRDFAVSPATLDPRPETETLVDAVLAVLDQHNLRGRPLRILDVGVGSGAILLTLLAELPSATGVGTDLSADALHVATSNAHALGVAGRVQFLRARSLEGVTGPFDIVVSNPPYIPSGDIAGLEPEVRDHDPRLALDGGSDGLAVYREIASDLPRALNAGWAFFEVGAGQAAEVQDLLMSALGRGRVVDAWAVADLGGIDRCVAISTRGLVTR